MPDLEKKYIDLQEQLLSQQAMFVQTQGYLAALKDELEDKVTLRTKELADANNELVTLLYRTSHDFKSPVASLKGLLNILKTFSSDPFFVSILDKANDTLKAQENLFSNLASYHLIKTSDVNPQEIGWPSVTHAVVTGLENTFNGIQEKIEWSLDHKLPLVTSKSLLEIILRILLENALVFSDKGHVKVSSEYINGFVQISICDQGEGIAPAISDKIYDMFFRGSVRSRGNGLGLFIAKSAADKLNGKINFESREGGGTVFKLFLPAYHVPS